MSRGAAFGLALVAAAIAAPGAAQDESRTRLDDFAVPADEGQPRVEQVSPGGQAIQSAPRVEDRAIAGAPLGERPSLQPDQLSSGVPSSASTQLNDGSNPTRPIPTAGSTAADSRPQGVTRLAGSDRCDPQLPERDLARCLQILELRAEEFNAREAPQLSAEESLLAEQQSDNDRAMVRSSENRLRFATMQEPDADLDSNQELASIYLGRGPVTAAPEPAPGELPDEAASLADIIVSIVQGSGSPPPE